MDDDDLVARVLLRAAHADTAALLRPGMLEKLACALRALDIEHSYLRFIFSEALSLFLRELFFFEARVRAPRPRHRALVFPLASPSKHAVPNLLLRRT